MRRGAAAPAAAALVMLAAASAAGADAIAIAPDLEAAGWRSFTFSDLPANRYVGHKDGTLEVVSTASISALHHAVAPDLAATPCLAWSWRVDESGPATDLRRHGGDDRALAIYVAYPFDADHAGFWETVIRAFVELVKGPDAPGRVVTYVWGGVGARGEVQESPYLQSAGGIILLRPGAQELGVWHPESVDLAADYARVFGDPVNPPLEVAVLADSDSTHSRSLGFVRDIRFDSSCRADPAQTMRTR